MRDKGAGMNFWSWLALASVMLFSAGSALAQSQASSADIRGTITDRTGGALPGVTITVTHPDRGVVRQAITDQSGQYAVLLLPPAAEYQIKIELPGFATQIARGLTLTVGQSVVLDFKMEVSGTATEVIVVAAIPLVETERSQQSNVVETKKIQFLPINGRNYLDFSLLTPGVTNQNSLSNSGMPMLPNSGLSFTGQSGRGNNVTIDGADNNDYSGGSVRNTLSQEAVQEFQINRSSFSAEFGHASGGLINIVTKSGTNALHGNLFFFWRDQRLDARNAFAFGPDFSDIDPQFSRIQYGLTAGGPIVKDRTFFFGSFERLDRKESQFLPFNQNPAVFQPTANQASLAGAIATLPASADIPAPAALAQALSSVFTLGPNAIARKLLNAESGVKPFYSDFTTGMVRLDHAFSPRNHFNARFSISGTYDEGFVIANLRARTNGANNSSRDTGIVLTDNAVFSPKIVNESRFQFVRRHFDSVPVDRNGPSLAISGIGDFGRNYNIDSYRTEDRIQMVDNLSLTYGRHRIKTGFDMSHIGIATESEIFFGGSVRFGSNIPVPLAYPSIVAGLNAQLPAQARISTDYTKLIAQLAAADKAAQIPNLLSSFTSLQAFNLGLPYFFIQGYGDPNVAIRANQIAFYVRDSIKITRNFTLEAGLRYDLEMQPEGIHRDLNNVGPRLGFSWDLGNNGRTVLRGGYGLYYAPLYQAVAFISRVLSQDAGIYQVAVPATGVPGLPASVTSISLYQTLLAQGFFITSDGKVGPKKITAANLAPFGITPGPNAPFSVVFSTDPSIQNPYSSQASLGMDRQFAENWAISVNYILNRGNKVLRLRDTNVMRSGVDADLGIPKFKAINPLLLQVNQAESSGMSVYHGGTFELTKRFADSYSIGIAYTLGKAIDTATDILLNFKPNMNDDVSSERALSLIDQRHRLVVHGVLGLPFRSGKGNPWYGRMLADINLAPIFTASSGRPWNLLVGYDANGDNEDVDRPFLVRTGQTAVYAGRNTGIGPKYVNMDLRLTKQLHFEKGINAEFSVEAFNLFNHVNFSGVNNIVPSETLLLQNPQNPLIPRSVVQPSQLSTFRVVAGGGRVTDFAGYTAAFPARQIQLGLKLNF
jgi:hypothetical protein